MPDFLTLSLLVSANCSDASPALLRFDVPLSPPFGTPLPTNGTGAKRQRLRHCILQSLVVPT